MKTIACLAVMCAVCLLVRRSDAKPLNSASKNRLNLSNHITVQGCVARSTGYDILMQTDPGITYNLEVVSKTIKLSSYLGEQVEVTGWESSESNNSSSLFYDTAANAVTVMVTSIRGIAGRCT